MSRPKNKKGKTLSSTAQALLDARLKQPLNIRKTAKKFNMNPADLTKYIERRQQCHNGHT